MAKRFVRDPREVVKAGDVVTVKIREVDLARRRIAGADSVRRIDSQTALTTKDTKGTKTWCPKCWSRFPNELTS